MRVKIDEIIGMLADVETIDDLKALLDQKGIDIGRATYYNWNRGGRGFNSAKVKRMADALGFDFKAIIEP